MTLVFFYRNEKFFINRVQRDVWNEIRIKMQDQICESEESRRKNKEGVRANGEQRRL